MRNRRTKFIAVFVLLCAGLLTAGCVGMSNAISMPEVRKDIFYIDGLSGDAKPIRIALLSDIPVGNFAMTPQRLNEVVQQVNDADPDLVFLAGDFVIGESKEGAAKRALDLVSLANFHPPQGVFAVMGNHDYWTDPAAIRAELTSAKVQVLENAVVRRGPFAIVGIGDRFSGHDDIARAAREAEAVGGIPIAFTHSPDLSPDLPRQFHILLAGHTHCGQMVAPIIGPIVRYSHGRRLYDPRYRCGRVNDADRSTFVTAGIGSGTVPLRFGAMPDWWIVEIKPKGSVGREPS